MTQNPKCSQCGHSLEVKPRPDRPRETYFVCPNCKATHRPFNIGPSEAKR